MQTEFSNVSSRHTEAIVGSDKKVSHDRAAEGKEQFLKLLVAQIQNQNPLDPMDDKEMVSQLAQFSSIEQAIETNTRLESLERTQNNAARLNLSNLMGKTASANTGNVQIRDDGSAPSMLAFTLDMPSPEVTVRLVDREGKLARSIDMGPRVGGPHQLNWDGRGDDGRLLLSGNYRMQVRARDAAGAEISGRTEIRGKVSRVDMEDQQPAVYLDDVRVPVGQLSNLHE